MFTSSVNFFLLLLSLATLTMTFPILEKQQLSDAEPHRDVVLRESGDPQPRLKPYVLSLFESFAANAKEQPDRHRYNTLRSFEITKAQGCKDSKYTFTFNMSSIPKEEDISKAIFRVYVNISTSFSSSQGSAQLTLTSNNSNINKKNITTNESQFVDFPVQLHIHDWLKNGQLKYLVNLGITIEANGPLECSSKDMGIVFDDANDSTQPTLVVYSFDHDEDRLLEKLNKAISEKMNSSESTADADRTRRSAGKTVSKGDSEECSKSSLSIDKGQLAQILDIEIDFPETFDLNVCGGHCPGSKYINQFHSKITYLLLATSEVEHLANKHLYSKTCVPTKYHSLNYIKFDQNGSVIKTLDQFSVAECSCVYSYSD
ncbi:PREDICTED: bone morphogenetic protein 4 [Amphimedon queenslandica]|uniref:TGF-beta family profile domain-containing protein n=1 Tax=Amphimedon queenslandica TaxID=400682 RepID=A0A1X7VWC2_AMPQE|nr:PREDICTED: bone morphogenetic protein 4 [Amphimedon queenslandica]|eukprot:XP_011410541.2 PREDICTED: bone morphogenetic protein 4 [Amphimedon queenslandica]